MSSFYPYRGGIAQFNADMFEELSKSNIVKAFNFKRQYPDFLFPGKTQYVTEEDEAVPVENTPVLDTANPFSYISAAKAIRKWDPDILIMKYWMSYFAPSLGFVARHMKKECKVIPILDNVIPHEKRFFDTPLTRYFISGCDGYIAMCSEVAEDLKALKSEAEYTILPHPLYSHFGDRIPRSAAEKALGLMPGKKNILFFGLIRDYKGLDILIDAFKDLDEGFQLIVAGEPYGSFDKYRKIIDGFAGKDRIKVFPKYIRDSEVKEYFSAADVTVLPYRSATQSGISSISYHFEVPMIVTDVGGLKETIGDKGTGIVAEKATPEIIRKEILNYFRNPLIRDMCSENIRKEKIRLSWSTFCKGLLDFADKLA